MTDNLDPQGPEDWAQLHDAFYRAVAASRQHLDALDERPVWQPAPESSKALWSAPLPEEPVPLDRLMATFEQQLLPYANGNLHPRFFGWVHGGGNLYGALGETCAALLNNNLGGRDHLAHQVEQQVLQWSRELFGFPADSSGLLTSGTSMATLLALAVARQQALGEAVNREGLHSDQPRLVGYTSAQGHHSISKAFALLGLGHAQLRKVAVQADLTLDPQALVEQLQTDRAAGLKPFCVIATLGSVNTGAIDDLNALQLICQQQGLWLHIDAAFGVGLTLLDEYQQQTAPAAQADSIAFDFHKSLQVPYAVGCLLVRDARLHQATFTERQAYLTPDTLGLGAGGPWPCDLGPELSRGFLALKVWFSLAALGKKRLAQMIRQQCQLAQ